ncbi:MAG: hypothetical protein ACYCW6_18500 [Candidatus Xenobia bacterium]
MRRLIALLLLLALAWPVCSQSEDHRIGHVLNRTYVAGPNRSRQGMYQVTNSLVALLLEGDISNPTLLTLQKAQESDAADYAHVVGLILGSPEFQKRRPHREV